jgi:hypothetical protein
MCVYVFKVPFLLLVDFVSNIICCFIIDDVLTSYKTWLLVFLKDLEHH